MASMKVIIFFGSSREGRLGYRVVRYVQELLQRRNIDCEVFDPQKMDFPMINKTNAMYPDFTQAPKWHQDALQKIQAADGYVVVSPEYNNSIPPALSNMMDHFVNRTYIYKPCSIVTYSFGKFGGIRAAMQLRAFLGELGMVTPQWIFAIPFVQNALNENGEPQSQDVVQGGEKMLKELEWFTRALKRAREEYGVPT